jgi:hypothetical protein
MGERETDVSDHSAGVVAHGLLNTMSVIAGAAELLRTEWDSISAARRHELFRLIELHAAEAGEALGSMVRGLPAEAVDLLDELSRRRDAGPGPADATLRLRRHSD